MKRITSFAAIIGLFLGGVGMAALLVEGRITNLSKVHFALAGAGIALFAIIHIRSLFGSFRSRTARFGAIVSVYVVIVVSAVAALNIISAALLPLTHWHVVDLTENSMFTLMPLSKKVIGNLDGELKIIAFFRGGRAGLEAIRPVDRLLRTMDAASPNIRLEILDPIKKPRVAEKYGITQNATLILEYQGRTEKINTITEQSLVNNAIRLLDDREKIVCFTSGHGEPGLVGDTGDEIQGFSLLKKALESRDYTVQKIELRGEREVPPECSVVMAAGPRTPFSEAELGMLDSYLQLGGRLFVGVDAGVRTNLELLLARWGIAMPDSIVMERVVEGRMTGQAGFLPTTMKPTIMLTALNYNKDYPITEDLSHIHPTQFLGARALFSYKTATKELKTVDLVWSKKDTWIERDVISVLKKGVSIMEPAKGDRPGPATLAMASSLTLQSPSEPLRGYSMQARLVAVGNAQWLANRLLVESKNFNPDLMLNMLAWLTGMEKFIAVGKRPASAAAFFLRARERRNLFYVAVVFLPELLLLMGALVWWVRR